MRELQSYQRKSMSSSEHGEEYRKEISNFIDFLSFFANELKSGSRQEAAMLKAFRIYTRTLKDDVENCVTDNFKQDPRPCSFKKRWREYMTKNYPNLLILYLIDTIAEMLDMDSVETGKRLDLFLPLLKGNLETSDAWKLVCQKPEQQMLKEAIEIPIVIANLSIGQAWMLIFLLQHFNVLSDEIDEWKFDCTVLDSAIPVIIRDYTHKLLMFKYLLPNLRTDRGPSEIDWEKPIPIHLLCPECRPLTNLDEKDWGYIELHTPDGLVDFHKCSSCKRVWAIRRSHIDESLWNLH